MTDRLPRFERGKPIRAADLNRIGIDALRGRIRGGKGIHVKEAGGNYIIELAERIPGVQRPVLAKITGEGAEDGYYTAIEVRPDGSSAGNAGRTWDGTAGNLPEVYDPSGEPGGWYVQTNLVIVRLELGVDDEGAPLWYIAEVRGNQLNPLALGGTTEGTTTADSTTWDQADQESNDGVDVAVVSRVVYDHSGDETLYAMVRTLSFDSLGHLRAISAETRVTVDTPEDCE